MKPPWGCVDNMLTQAGSSSHSLAEGSKLRPSQEKFFFLSIFWELLGSKQLCSFTAGHPPVLCCFSLSSCFEPQLSPFPLFSSIQSHNPFSIASFQNTSECFSMVRMVPSLLHQWFTWAAQPGRGPGSRSTALLKHLSCHQSPIKPIL